MTSTPAPAARWSRRSSTARSTCAPTSRSTRASACAASSAVTQLKREYAWALDLQVCVFPQEGLINDPGTEELLVAACAGGADLIGGCPYTDTHPHEHIARIFAIARRFDLDIDFHLDFDLDPGWMHLDEVCRATDANRYGGRVAIGHVTKLSAIPPERQIEIAQRLADAGVAVTVLPATDLFLMGRGADHNVPRGVARADRLRAHGVTCSLATNNVLNPFTPFGDCSLTRMANLYANIAQLGRREELEGCLEMITTSAARLMNLPAYGIAAGNPADLVVLPCATSASAIAETRPPAVRPQARPPHLHQRPRPAASAGVSGRADIPTRCRNHNVIPAQPDIVASAAPIITSPRAGGDPCKPPHACRSTPAALPPRA